jgi:hypothetical protein
VTRSFNIGNLCRTEQESKVKSGETTDIDGRLMDTESVKTERKKETYQILENLDNHETNPTRGKTVHVVFKYLSRNLHHLTALFPS